MKLYSFLSIVLLVPSLCCTVTTDTGPKPVKAVNDSTVLPGKVLNLSNWKLTLPVCTKANGNPDEVKQPALNTYTDADYFFTSKDNQAVTFRANAGGATTSGSNFPRSELREMMNDGKEQASWSSASGTHTLFIDQRITHLPDVRKQMVVGQIHDADKYIIFFRIEDNKLLLSVNGGDRETLDDNYALGTRFNVKLVVSNNVTKCYYNGDLKYTYNGSFGGAYFKAGAYVQSSCKGKKQTPGELCSAYGEVEIYNVWVKHE
jgi:hypothetical protein